ncbi:MAG TPA: hypothetical protein VFG69_01190 [Nannocystaceae bacterium]|nr:hypothetical protein [Nannocystaceae bacterium]
MLARPILCALVVCGATACGPTSVIEGRMAWDGPQFGVDFVAPPWEIESESASELRLRIEAEIFGASLDGSPPTHVLVLAAVDGPTGILDLLPDDAQPDAGELPELPDTSGELPDTSGDLPDELPEGWDELDLDDPTEVALFELDHLVTAEQADLVRELRPFTTASGLEAIEYEVVVPPGLFLRGFYLPSRGPTVRALFASLFDLDDSDLDAMALTLRTDANGPLSATEGG